MSERSQRDPWERLPRETGKAFAAFQGYRDQPVMRRSLRRLAETLGRSMFMVGRWSRTHEWVSRVTAWDAEQDRLSQAVLAEERRAFAKRLAASGALMQAKGLGKVRAYIDRLDREGNLVALAPGQHYIDEMAIQDAARLVEAGARLERLGRGLPDPDAMPLFISQVNQMVGGISSAGRRVAEVLQGHPEAIGDLTALFDRLEALESGTVVDGDAVELEVAGDAGDRSDDG